MIDSLANRSILLSGATGFLGRASYLRLKQAGARVIGTGYSSSEKGEEDTIYIDLTEPKTFLEINRLGPFDTVVHCAAILPNGQREIDLLVANEKMTYHLMDWAVQNNISHFVFLSSCSVYGYSSEEKNESSLPAPENIYAISKLACEQIISSFALSNGIKACSLRISAPYGPNQKAQTVIKTFLKQAANGDSITLMGNGKRSQDFVYETDVGNAIECAVARCAEGVFNITGGQAISMKDLAEKVLSIFHRKGKNVIEFRGKDAQEGFRGIYPIRSAKQRLGYNPRIKLETGLRQTAQGWGLL